MRSTRRHPGATEAGDGFDPAAMRELFGLTPGEARIAAALGEGQSLQEITRRFGISYHTVRTHVRQIFAKTGVRRQAALVRLLWTRASLLTSKRTGMRIGRG